MNILVVLNLTEIDMIFVNNVNQVVNPVKIHIHVYPVIIKNYKNNNA